MRTIKKVDVIDLRPKEVSQKFQIRIALRGRPQPAQTADFLFDHCSGDPPTRRQNTHAPHRGPEITEVTRPERRRVTTEFQIPLPRIKIKPILYTQLTLCPRQLKDEVGFNIFATLPQRRDFKRPCCQAAQEILPKQAIRRQFAQITVRPGNHLKLTGDLIICPQWIIAPRLDCMQDDRLFAQAQLVNFIKKQDTAIRLAQQAVAL